jgi:zinc/manganese transport system substrate-binding protein
MMVCTMISRGSPHSKKQLILLILIIITLIPIAQANERGGGLIIAASFPDIAVDISKLVCPGDQVHYIAPPGADPHTYSLRASDLSLLQQADLIISTAHTAFEKEIHDKYAAGEFKGRLIEIPSIPGIRIKTNPMTGKANLHMPIYDPYNLIVFIRNVSETMSMLRPQCSRMYNLNAEKMIRTIESIINNTPRLNLEAVAEAPYMQYAVEWTGIRVRYLMVKEEGVPASPLEMSRIEKGMANGTIQVVIVSSPPKTVQAQRLLGLAKHYGLPVIYVKPPFSNTSFIDKLEYISSQLGGISISRASAGRVSTGSVFNRSILEPVDLCLGGLLLALTIMYLWVRER